MSTEATPVIQPTAEPPAPAPAPAPVSESLLSSIRVLRPAGAPPAVDPPAPESTQEPTVTPEPTSEPKPEAPKPEPPKVEPKEEPTAGMSEKASVRFNKVVSRAEAAEKERDAVRSELDAARKEAQAIAVQLKEVDTIRRDALKAQEELTTYREQLRIVNIERDPEFQRQYNGQILSRQQQMLEMAVSAGAQQADVIQAINTANEDALEAFRDSLTSAKQRIWDANRADIERIAYEKKEAIRNSGQTWEQLEETRKRTAATEAERIKADNVTAAKTTVDALWREIPDLDKEGLEVKSEIEEWLTDQVINAPREHLIRQLAVGQIAQKVIAGQKSQIDQLTGELAGRDKELEELREKLGEQETFIKEVSSHSPRGPVGGAPKNAEQNGSLLSTVRVHVPGR